MNSTQRDDGDVPPGGLKTNNLVMIKYRGVSTSLKERLEVMWWGRPRRPFFCSG